ncbi:M61 family metallopeptidase [Massilia sp. YIM B02443]|uniref:M61 family metallopeptidase n=1 Tax=Massilia sp. YIM B02443 TaxID=3050127 RepID=UPI0025B66744|nr:peptidase M61 [Massilia sp. YIM B02443]MDN4035849.1 peptidase M61 [Massilia sp. YIM B02443]
MTASRSFLARAARPAGALAVALAFAFPAVAATATVPAVPAIGKAAYPGTIALHVDASNLSQQVFRMRLSMPARPGPMTLLYPQWAPGNHGPNIPLTQLAGLKFSAGGKPVEWTRDPVNVYAFHVTVPQGATTLEAEYQFLSPLDTSQGRITMTDDILGVQWQSVALYPAGYDARRITVQPTLTLPKDWQFASALEVEGRTGDEVRFKPHDLDTLVDSPLFAGRHFKRIDLAPGAKTPVMLNVVADNAENLEAKPEQIALHRAMVDQAIKLFGSTHYKHYDFLFAISDEFGGIGREHHQSSENGVKLGYFTEWNRNEAGRELLPHEFVHSWNGKFRRPAGQEVPNFNTPLQNELLWVYEGQTQFWGKVLAARSGLVSQNHAREALAIDAARYDNTQGRDWRAMQDTVNDPIINGRRPIGWGNWQRSEDYYTEGMLIWLDVDTRIREMSGDKRSLEDFARAFFGVENGRVDALYYAFDDVVAALNKIQKFDWAPFLRKRLDGHGPGAPLDGLARAGWKLVYSDTPSDAGRAAEERSKSTDFTYSLGFSVRQDGGVTGVIWDGVGFRAGLAANTTIVAVNNRVYKGEVLKAVVRDAKAGKGPIELLVKKGNNLRTISLDYKDGLRYPRLERIAGTRDRLEALFKAK